LASVGLMSGCRSEADIRLCSGFPEFYVERGSYSGTQGQPVHLADGMRNFAQPEGEKSPVPKRSKIRGKLAELSKGILGFTISRFESW